MIVQLMLPKLCSEIFAQKFAKHKSTFSAMCQIFAHLHFAPFGWWNWPQASSLRLFCSERKTLQHRNSCRKISKSYNDSYGLFLWPKPVLQHDRKFLLDKDNHLDDLFVLERRATPWVDVVLEVRVIEVDAKVDDEQHGDAEEEDDHDTKRQDAKDLGVAVGVFVVRSSISGWISNNRVMLFYSLKCLYFLLGLLFFFGRPFHDVVTWPAQEGKA